MRRRRRRVTLLRRRITLSGVGIIAGTGLGGWRSAAENRLAEVAEKASLLLMRFRSRMGRRLELRDSLGRRLQGVLLNEHGLGENIGRVGGRADGVVDEGFGLRIARRRAIRVDALEQTGKHLAFFGGHVTLQFGPCGPRGAYGDRLRPFQDGVGPFFACRSPAALRRRRAFTPLPLSFRQLPQ